MRDQQEQRARRRFLEILQQRIGGIGVHVVGRIDDDDAVAAVMRGQRQEAADPPDLVDGQRGLEGFGLLVERPRQVQHRGMRAAGDLPVERRGRIARREAVRRGVGRRDATADSAPAGMRCVALPMPRGPANTSACGSLPRAMRGGELRHDARRARTRCSGLRRLGNAVERIVLLRCDAFVHACYPRRRLWRGGGSRLDGREDGRRDHLLDLFRLARRVDDDAALGLGRGDRQIGLAPPLVDGERLPSRSGRRRASPRARHARAAGRAAGSRSRISVMSGIMPLMATFSSASTKARIEIAGDALVDAGGIEEAVAQHDRAALDRRPDHLLDMVGARRGEQHRLHLRAERLGGTGQQHVPHRFGARRAARFARHQHVIALRRAACRRAA